MYRITISLVLGATAALAAPAFANDGYGSGSAHARKELMKQCLSQQHSQNSGASEMDMRKTCHDQVKMQMSEERSDRRPDNPYAPGTSPGNSATPSDAPAHEQPGQPPNNR